MLKGLLIKSQPNLTSHKFSPILTVENIKYNILTRASKVIYSGQEC